MPIYEYECGDCGRQFERIVYRTSSAATCDSCGSTRVEKRYSAFAVGASDSLGSEAPSGCTTCGAERPGMCQQMN
ncbi:MAG: zinc ribbon domain-containing protein [Acidobacteria bacterium]|nr:zinc ribbon domain-containing protein [Acidobacteriota bacterium]MYC83190.1 zinc ribbon domain-containing protein [Acidobacteriota bacterium]